MRQEGGKSRRHSGDRRPGRGRPQGTRVRHYHHQCALQRHVPPEAVELRQGLQAGGQRLQVHTRVHNGTHQVHQARQPGARRSERVRAARQEQGEPMCGRSLGSAVGGWTALQTHAQRVPIGQCEHVERASERARIEFHQHHSYTYIDVLYFTRV